MKKLLATALLLGGTALAADPLLVNGAGATFPYPLYLWWFSEYYKLHPDIHFNYQAIGSGAGIQQFTAGTIDFGASDAPLSDEQIAKVSDVVHVPTVMGAVVVAFNLPIGGLRLTPQLLADVFLGKVAKWNDAALAKANPGVKLPDTPIAVVHRSDGSGTSLVFTDYLAKVSPEWKEKVGSSTSVKWPVGLGGKGSDGVTGLIKQVPGAIGYLELAYARQSQLPIAELQNRDGSFVKPTPDNTSRAAAGVRIPADYRILLTNSSGKSAWPIASFTYLLVHKNMKDQAKGRALASFLWWAVHDGQALAEPLDYAPLPEATAAQVAKTIEGLQIDGKPIPIAK